MKDSGVRVGLAIPPHRDLSVGALCSLIHKVGLRVSRTFDRAMLLLALFSVAAASCTEFRESLPTGHEVLPSPPPSRFEIVGHWEASSNQGGRIAFDVTADGRIANGHIELHHDCDFGRHRVIINGYEAEVAGDAFLTHMEWQVQDTVSIYTGRLTISGRFEGHRISRGGFVNSIKDVERFGQPIDAVCPSLHGSWQGEKRQ